MRHAEASVQILFRVAALLLAQHEHADAAHIRIAGHERGIIAKRPVAVQLYEAVQFGDVVERERPARVAREIHALPRREITEDLRFERDRFLFQRADLSGEIHALRLVELFQSVDLGFELEQRLFKFDDDVHAGFRRRASTGARAVKKRNTFASAGFMSARRTTMSTWPCSSRNSAVWNPSGSF